MLDALLANKDALKSMMMESICKNVRRNLPSDHEFEVLSDVCDLLQPLKDLTSQLSGQNYVTSSIAFPAVYSLINNTLMDIRISSELVNDLRNVLIKELEKRFDYLLSEDIYVAITFLDFKFKNFKFVCDERARQDFQNRAKQYLRNHYTKFYANSEGSISPNDDTQAKLSIQVKIKAASKRKTNFSFMSNLFDTHALAVEDNLLNKLEKELNMYSVDVPTSSEQAPTLYLKDSFPILYKISKGFLCIPATSVPSESLFSAAGLVATYIRNALRPETVENLVFLKQNTLQ